MGLRLGLRRRRLSLRCGLRRLRLLPVVARAVVVAAILIVVVLAVHLVAAVVVIALRTLALTLANVVLALLVLAALAVLLLKTGVQHAVVVVGVLEIVLGQNAVTRRAGVSGHRQELFHELLRVAARTAGIAVEIRIAASASTSAPHWTWFAAVAAALTVFHSIVLLMYSK